MNKLSLSLNLGWSSTQWVIENQLGWSKQLTDKICYQCKKLRQSDVLMHTQGTLYHCMFTTAEWGWNLINAGRGSNAV